MSEHCDPSRNLGVQPIVKSSCSAPKVLHKQHSHLDSAGSMLPGFFFFNWNCELWGKEKGGSTHAHTLYIWVKACVIHPSLRRACFVAVITRRSANLPSAALADWIYPLWHIQSADSQKAEPGQKCCGGEVCNAKCFCLFVSTSLFSLFRSEHLFQGKHW